MSDFKEQSYLCLAPDGRVYHQKTIFRDLGDQSAVLDSIGGQLPVDIGMAFKLPNGLPVGIQRKNRNIFMYTAMPALKLNTVWRPYGKDPVKMMLVGISEAETDIQASYLWTPPETMKVWLVVVFAYTGQKEMNDYGFNSAYLVASGNKKFYRLPLPNLYEHCQICMGTKAYTAKDTWQDRYIEAYEQFWNSPWNTDMREKHKAEHTTAMFQFNAKGKQLPVPENWADYCLVTNNGNYSDLPIV